MKYKKGTFITVPNREVLAGLKPDVQCVFMWLCNFADDDGICYPSHKKLSTCSGVSKRQIMRCVKALEDAGLITKTKRKRGKKNETNVYQIIIVDTEVVTDRHQVVTNSHQGSDSQSLGVVTNSHSELNPLELNPINSTHLTTVKDLQASTKVSPAEINQVIDLFQEINPGRKLYGLKMQRDAALWLIGRGGLKKALALSRAILEAQERPYSPTVTTPLELKNKLAYVKRYFEREKNNLPGVVNL